MFDPQWKSLKFYNPTEVLVGMDKMFNSVGIKKYLHPADILLQRRVRHISEMRRCAIFLHGASQVLGRKIAFATFESSDYDYVGAYELNGETWCFPIQMKQLVPARLNAQATLQQELDKLAKYRTSSRLVVGVHVNRQMRLMPKDLRVAHLPVKEVWLFGQLGLQGDTWLLLGNLKAQKCNAYTFKVPVA